MKHPPGTVNYCKCCQDITKSMCSTMAFYGVPCICLNQVKRGIKCRFSNISLKNPLKGLALMFAQSVVRILLTLVPSLE